MAKAKFTEATDIPADKEIVEQAPSVKTTGVNKDGLPVGVPLTEEQINSVKFKK